MDRAWQNAMNCSGLQTSPIIGRIARRPVGRPGASRTLREVGKPTQGIGKSLDARGDRRAGTTACALQNRGGTENRSVADKVDPWKRKNQSEGSPESADHPSPRKLGRLRVLVTFLGTAGKVSRRVGNAAPFARDTLRCIQERATNIIPRMEEPIACRHQDLSHATRELC